MFSFTACLLYAAFFVAGGVASYFFVESGDLAKAEADLADAKSTIAALKAKL